MLISPCICKAEERGEDLPIAITLGNDPIITLMGATPLKYDQSEYEMAGALRGKPVPDCHRAADRLRRAVGF